MICSDVKNPNDEIKLICHSSLSLPERSGYPSATNVGLAWEVSAVPEKVREWYRSSDPVLIFVRDLVAGAGVSKQEIAEMERRIVAMMDQAVKFALASPYPEPEEALKDIFA